MFYLVFIVLAIFLFIKILKKPIKFIFKLLLNTGLGFLFLFAASIIAGMFGIVIELTLLNAVLVGFLGLPGLILVFLLCL